MMDLDPRKDVTPILGDGAQSQSFRELPAKLWRLVGLKWRSGSRNSFTRNKWKTMAGSEAAQTQSKTPTCEGDDEPQTPISRLGSDNRTFGRLGSKEKNFN